MDRNKKPIVSNEYEIIKQIGHGSFGEVYLTRSLSQNILSASKIEEKTSKRPCKVFDEYKIYKKLELKGLIEGIPKIHNIYETSDFNVLVMELLGDSLDHKFVECGKIFKMQTVLKLGYDILCLIEGVHRCGFIHRDIKPNNFMFGFGEKENNLYIVDFGLSKRYSKSNVHICYKSGKSLVGTARYTSINVHMGIEPSRRDDMISIGYMLIFFAKGSLPWQGTKKRDGKDHIKLIGDVKMEIGIKKLCEDLPECFYKYLHHCSELEFDEQPNYNYLKKLLVDTAKSLRFPFEYEWITKQNRRLVNN